MNIYKIEFSEELKKEYGLKDFTVTTQADKQEYLQALRLQVYQQFRIVDKQLVNGNNINIYGD